jgi:hypothetical protein
MYKMQLMKRKDEEYLSSARQKRKFMPCYYYFGTRIHAFRCYSSLTKT